MEDYSIKKLVGVLYDVLVKVDRLILLADFFILDCEIGHDIQIILDILLLATRRSLVDMEYGNIKFWVHNDEISFSVCKAKKQPMESQIELVIYVVDLKVTNYMELDLGLLQLKELK